MMCESMVHGHDMQIRKMDIPIQVVEENSRWDSLPMFATHIYIGTSLWYQFS